MKRVAATGIALCLLSGSSEAAGVQLFNTEVLGRRTSEAVTLLVDKAAGQAEPYVVWADVSCGKYVAGSAFYRKPVDIAVVVAALDGLYGRFKLSSTGPIRLWRVTDKRFAIQVAEEKDAEAVRVTYISFGGEPCAEAATTSEK